MYNVMVTAGDNAWEEGVYVWDRTRMLEYTEDVIRDALKALTPDALDQAHPAARLGISCDL